jgi:AcrR family transcriptional regulator
MRGRQPCGPKRRYRLGRRRAQADKTRAKLVAAARRILMGRDGLAAFGLEGVAKRAGVTRLTVYNQFGSKTGLLEAVCDDIAQRGRLAERLGAAFQSPDAHACLDAVIEAFLEFWKADRTACRRLRSMAILDPTFKGATMRDERRAIALRAALLRVAGPRGCAVTDVDECTRIIAMLTSFETFDALGAPGVDPVRITSVVRKLARAAVEAFLGKRNRGTEPEDERQSRI